MKSRKQSPFRASPGQTGRISLGVFPAVRILPSLGRVLLAAICLLALAGWPVLAHGPGRVAAGLIADDSPAGDRLPAAGLSQVQPPPPQTVTETIRFERSRLRMACPAIR